MANSAAQDLWRKTLHDDYRNSEPLYGDFAKVFPILWNSLCMGIRNLGGGGSQNVLLDLLIEAKTLAGFEDCCIEHSIGNQLSNEQPARTKNQRSKDQKLRRARIG